MDEVFGIDLMNQLRKIPMFISDYKRVMEGFRRSRKHFWDNPKSKRVAVQLSSSLIELIADTIVSGASGFAFVCDQNTMDSFEGILENAEPFGLRKGQLAVEFDTIYISRELCTKYLFDPVINPLIETAANLIPKVNEIHDDDGVANELKYLCITGDLGNDKYFQQRICEAFGADSKYGLSIRIPRRPNLCVIDGVPLKLFLCPNPNCVSVTSFIFHCDRCSQIDYETELQKASTESGRS